MNDLPLCINVERLLYFLYLVQLKKNFPLFRFKLSLLAIIIERKMY